MFYVKDGWVYSSRFGKMQPVDQQEREDKGDIETTPPRVAYALIGLAAGLLIGSCCLCLKLQ